MRVLALIPARGGSKRLPGKNVKILGGKPLIAWTIEVAKQSDLFVDILISTDDPEIASVSRELGAYVPWLRPSELSTDTARSVDVALHALDFYEDKNGPVDGLMLLQPTSPFRSVDSIDEAIKLFSVHGNERAIVSMSEVSVPLAWCFNIANGELEPLLDWEGLSHRSQDVSKVYAPTGSVYLISPESLRREMTFFPKSACPLVVKKSFESIDIDTPEDWKIAEGLLAVNAICI